MENYTYIRELFCKYLDNSISRDEYVILLEYFGKSEDDGDIRTLILAALSEDEIENDQIRLNNAVDNVQRKLRQELMPAKKTGILKKYFPYAAAVLFIATAGIIFYKINATQQQIEKQVLITDVDPGGNKAILTLSDGSTHELSTNQSQIQINTKGIQYANGNSIVSSTDIKFATLSTPKGGEYQIVLSDGTKVWLNAATTLQYAANFKGQAKRKVKLLAGEAYFEVAKDKNHPFVVETQSQEVEVLGTHFNINSYADEGTTVTTLTEGSVRVTKSDDKKSMLLTPGNQIVNSKGTFTVQPADYETALAWKEGRIYFKDASIQEVLRQVSRWYNIEVEYQGAPTKEVFNGGIKRNAKLSALLHILELSNVQFSLSKKNNITTLTIK